MADPRITRLEVNVTVEDDLRIDVTIDGAATGDDAAAKLDKAAVVINRILGKA